MKKETPAYHIAHNTFRSDRYAKSTNDPDALDLSFMPPELPGTKEDAGKKLWLYATQSMNHCGMLRETDRPALIVMCQCAQQREDLEKGMSALYKLLEKTVIPEDKIKVYKQIGIQQKLIDEKNKDLRLWFVQFGMTPVSRDKVKVEKDDVLEEDPMASMMNKKLKVVK